MPPELLIACARAALACVAAWALFAVERGRALPWAGAWLAWAAALFAAGCFGPERILAVDAVAFLVLAAMSMLAFRDAAAGSGVWLATMVVGLFGLFANVLSFLGHRLLTDVMGTDLLLLSATFRTTLQGAMAIAVLAATANTRTRELEQRLAEQQETIEELRAAARHDALTGLLNRRAFEGLRAAPLPGFAGAVALIDLDGFKQINDAWGHAAGDAALQAVGRALQARVRTSDYVFRWGGDEFLALLVGGSREDAERRLTEVAAALAGARVAAAAPRLSLELSWGVAEFAGADELEGAVAAADAEMYARRGRRADPDAR